MNPQFKKGVLELCVLRLIEREDTYGYELATEISKAFEISEGTLYPILRRLLDDRQIESYLKESSEGPPRKYYRITRAGRAFLRGQLQAWFDFNDQVQTILGKDATP